MIDFQIGNTYNGISGSIRTALNKLNNHYLHLSFVLHRFDDNKNTKVEQKPFHFYQDEMYSKLSVAVPVAKKAKFETGIALGTLTDYYKTDMAIYNKTNYQLGKVFVKIEDNTLNCLMYPTKGYHHIVGLQYFNGVNSKINENYLNGESRMKNLSWMQFRSLYNRYFQLSSKFSVGTYAEIQYSNRQLQQESQAELLQTARFEPTPYLRYNFNSLFSANKFAAFGLQPLMNITPNIHFRTEAYLFVPFEMITNHLGNVAVYSKPIINQQFVLENALVYKFKIASISLYSHLTNHNYTFGFNLGLLLFKQKFAAL